MVEDLMQKIGIWASEVAMHAVQLSSAGARSAFLAEHHRRLVADARNQGMDEYAATVLADACVDGAERIMQEYLARGLPAKGGKA